MSVVSKLLKRIVSRHLVAYFTDSRLFPDLQSAHRANHSTETTVLNILSDNLTPLNYDNLAALMLLDLPADFDSVHLATLLQRLRESYGLNRTVIDWFASPYLSGRTQCVRSSMSSSLPFALLYGVPQGSVIGMVLFQLYTTNVLGFVKRYQLHPHAYTNETQIYGFCSPSAVSALVDRVSACFYD
jgi:Reverse transcriptase (RNA-dependent DNA polymerase)